MELSLIRLLTKKLRVWFKAKQVASILGYKNTDDAIKRHVSENHKRTLLFCCPRETQGQQIKCCPPETGGPVFNISCHFIKVIILFLCWI